METMTVNINNMNIQEALEKYRDLKTELSIKLDTLNQLKFHIKKLSLSSGEIVKVDGASTSFRKGYVRSSWDNRGLRGYAVAHPEILTFVSETRTSATVYIRLAE